MRLKKLLLVCGLDFLLSSAIFAANTSVLEYDNVPITPQTWQEVDLTYDNYIDGKKYTEIVKLLRPISWLKQHNLDVGHLNKPVHLNKDDAGVDVTATVTAIKPTNIFFDNELAIKNIKYPVIGVFIRHANNVTDYTFKDQSGNLEIIQATPEHPFYSIDRHDYIPIGQIWNDSNKYNGNERIQTETGKSVTLVDAKVHDAQIEAVYNFEVYKSHNYLVGYSNLLVHNWPCNGIGDGDGYFANSFMQNLDNDEPVTDLFNFKYSRNNDFLFRLDTRPPSVIINQGAGFSGTNEHYRIAVFGNKNVFASKSREGVGLVAEVKVLANPEMRFHLYRIEGKGLNALSFTENYIQNAQAFVDELTRYRLIEGLTDSELQLFEQNQLRTSIEQTLIDTYVAVDEIHIQGPVDANRLTYMGRYQYDRIHGIDFIPDFATNYYNKR